MWDELYAYKAIPMCSCDAATVFANAREEEKIHQFVMGLDESHFGNVATLIIDSDPMLDISQVYAKVICEEQRLNSSKTHEHN